MQAGRVRSRDAERGFVANAGQSRVVPTPGELGAHLGPEGRKRRVARENLGDLAVLGDTSLMTAAGVVVKLVDLKDTVPPHRATELAGLYRAFFLLAVFFFLTSVRWS